MGGPAEPPAATEEVTGVLLDEMYPPMLARGLRERGHDVVAVLDIEVGLASKTDDDVLAWAARNERCVVTENVSDFARLASLGVAHCGLIMVRALRYPRTSAGLVRIRDALDELLAAKGLPDRNNVHWL